MITKNTPDIKRSEQDILNRSKDDEFEVLAFENLEYVPANANNVASLRRKTTENLAQRVDDYTTANIIYIGIARVGTPTSDAYWQIQKIDETTGTVITWADGNDNFDNIWDNRTSITYS